MVERKELETIDFPVFPFDVDEKKKGALSTEKVSRNLLASDSELFRVQNLKTCRLRNSDFSSSLFHLRKYGYGDEKKKRRNSSIVSSGFACKPSARRTNLLRY